jgi:hypothetical protein
MGGRSSPWTAGAGARHLHGAAPPSAGAFPTRRRRRSRPPADTPSWRPVVRGIACPRYSGCAARAASAPRSGRGRDRPAGRSGPHPRRAGRVRRAARRAVRLGHQRHRRDGAVRPVACGARPGAGLRNRPPRARGVPAARDDADDRPVAARDRLGGPDVARRPGHRDPRSCPPTGHDRGTVIFVQDRRSPCASWP